MKTISLQTNVDVLNEFFTKDGLVHKYTGKRRRSIWLCLKGDLYSVIVDESCELSQVSKMNLILVGFDLLARIERGRQPGKGENGTFFKSFLKRHVKSIGEVRAQLLWNMRNSVIHSGSLSSPETAIFSSGSQIPIQLKKIRGTKTSAYFIRSFYSALMQSSRRVFDLLLKAPKLTQNKRCQYIDQFGFVYLSKVINKRIKVA